MTTILTIVSVLLIAAYTAAVCIKGKGIPASISTTFYSLAHPLWFSITMVGTAFLLMPAILEVTPESYQFVAFLACFGLIMVGAAPHFKEDFEKKIHTAGALLCIVLSQVWVLLSCPWWLFVWAAYILYTAVCMKKRWSGSFKESFLLTKPMFWVEIAALTSIYMSLFTLIV